jgi:hypothetical protein
MRIATICVLFLLLVTRAFADGFSSMPLKDVLLKTDVIILVEISENKGTTTNRTAGQDDLIKAVVYTNDIKAKVISVHRGEFTSAEFVTKYSLTLMKGVWLVIPGSGLEGRMAPGEKYVLMLRQADGAYNLQRAEKAEKLDEVLRLKGELDDEDRRVAEAQAKIPNGIYHHSDVATAQKVRLEDGRRVRIGEKCDVDMTRKELTAPYNLILLTLTLGTGKPEQCVLMVDGKAYWLFDHHWAAGEKSAGAEGSPRLYCSLTDPKNAEAIAAFFGITIAESQKRKSRGPMKRREEGEPPAGGDGKPAPQP